jgi:hypothetical protein
VRESQERRSKMRAVIAAVVVALMTVILALHATPSGAQIP